MKWPLVGVIAVAIFALGAALGSNYAHYEAAQRALELQEQTAAVTQRRIEKADAAAAAHEEDKDKIIALHEDIQRTVNDAKQNAFYLPGSMCLDESGVRAVNRAARPGATSGQPAPAVR